MKRSLIIMLVLLFASSHADSKSWVRSKFLCPLCKSENHFFELKSQTTSHYKLANKYQMVFWPENNSYWLYTCQNCGFTVFKEDFDSIPNEKVQEIEAYLSALVIKKKVRNYNNIPIHFRMDNAENIYKILGRSHEFWCRFYRLKAFYNDNDKLYEEADQDRMRTMLLANMMLLDEKYKGKEKENLTIIAAMKYFTGDPQGASVFLEKAAGYTYKNEALSEEKSRQYDKLLTDLIKDYKKMVYRIIGKKESPKNKKSVIK